MVSYLPAAYKVSIARACSVVGLHRSMWYYQAKKDDSEVVAKLTELAEDLPTRGFDVYYNRIRTEGLVWNRKRVLRVYRGMKLGMRRRHKKRVPTRIQQPLETPGGLNEVWSIDFMSDSLSDGLRVRMFNVIDDYNREALAVEPGLSFPGISGFFWGADGKELIKWIRKVQEAGNEYFQSVAHSLINHWDNILNFFNNRSTNAHAESLNAQIKLFRANLRGVTDTKYFLYRLQKIFA